MPRMRGTNLTVVMALCGALFLLWFLLGSPSRAPSYRDYQYMSDKDMLAKTNSELKGILNQQHQDSWASDNVAEVKGSNQMDPAEELFKPKEKTQAEVEEVSIAGRKKMPKQKTGEYDTEPARYPTTDDEGQSTSKIAKNDPGKEAAREELQRILKKSPIIIFSKSTCPYSKRAKNLLLNTYKITPAPYVAELDQMTEPVPTDGDTSVYAPVTMGRKLQDLLAELTGRKTVPNIMIASVMKSLGGSDELLALDEDGKLEETLKKWGGRQIVEVRRRMEA